MAELPDQAEGIGGLLGMPATGRKPFTAYTMRKIRRIMDDTMKITYLLAVQFYCFPFQGDAGSFGQAEAQNQWYGIDKERLYILMEKPLPRMEAIYNTGQGDGGEGHDH